MSELYEKVNEYAFHSGERDQDATAKPAKAAKETDDNDQSLATLAALAGPTGPAFQFGKAALETLQRRCPDYVTTEDWQMAVRHGQSFLATWGPEAARLGWVEADLFAIADVPPNVHPSFQRLSRYDCLGLVWFLRGRRVVSLTSHKAVIETQSGARTTFLRRSIRAARP